MTRVFYYLACAISLFLFCHLIAQAEPMEAISLPFGLDNKEWTISSQQRTDTVYTCEFTPKGQTIENWKELVTLQFYPNLQKSSANEFLKTFLARLQKDEPKVQIRPISNSFDNAIVEWSISNSKHNPDQYEVDRIIKGQKGLHMIHYAIKTSDWEESERTKWLKFLNTATLKKAE